jgi:biopolymer transport protein ExbD
MSVFGLRRRKDQDSSVDIAPLLDMVFILLIFFIVTSTFTRETGLELQKPQAATALELNRESIVIGLSPEGGIYLNETVLELHQLQSVLRTLLTYSPERPVILAVDRQVPTGFTVEVMDQCRLAGAVNVFVSAEVKR